MNILKKNKGFSEIINQRVHTWHWEICERLPWTVTFKLRLRMRRRQPGKEVLSGAKGEVEERNLFKRTKGHYKDPDMGLQTSKG